MNSNIHHLPLAESISGKELIEILQGAKNKRLRLEEIFKIAKPDISRNTITPTIENGILELDFDNKNEAFISSLIETTQNIEIQRKNDTQKTADYIFLQITTDQCTVTLPSCITNDSRYQNNALTLSKGYYFLKRNYVSNIEFLEVYPENYYNRTELIPISQIDGINIYNTPNTAFISKQGNDETGEVGVWGKPFATFMGALAKVPDGCENYTIWYHSDKLNEYFVENNIDLSNGGSTSSLRYLNVIVPKNISIYCNSNENRSLFQTSVNSLGILLAITGLNGEGGNLYRVGNPTEISNSHIFGNNFLMSIKNITEIKNTTAGRISDANFTFLKNINSIECNSLDYCFAINYYTAKDVLVDNVSVKNNIGYIFKTAIPYRINNSYLEAHTAIAKIQGLSAKSYNTTYIVNEGQQHFIPNGFLFFKLIEYKNCEFYNYSNSDNSRIFHQYNDNQLTQQYDNCYFYKKNTNTPHFTGQVSNFVRMSNCRGNGSFGQAKELEDASKFCFFIEKTENIQVGDEYDIWMTPYSGNIRHSDSQAVKLTYIVQAGDGENEIINGLINLWSEKVAEGHRLFIGGKDGFTVTNEIMTGINGVGTPYPNKHHLVIQANSVLDWLPHAPYRDGLGMCPDNKNFIFNRNTSKTQNGLVNIIDVFNENKNIQTSRFFEYEIFSQIGENNNIIY